MFDNCLCVCAFVHTYRMDRKVLRRRNSTGTVFVDRILRHQVLEDGHAYSTVDDLQQQMFGASSNPAYIQHFEPSQQPARHSHYGRSTTELSQELEMVRSGTRAYGGVQLKEAASDK